MALEPAPASAGQPAGRLHWIDWLRVVAVVGIVVYHSLRPFDLTDWHVKNAETSDLLGSAQIILSTFGLAVLFLLAGAGAQFALRRRGPSQFVRERTGRLLVPFVVGTLLLSPVQASIEAAARTSDSPSVPDWIGWWTGVAPGWLAADGASPQVFGIGYHLWFLGFLFAFSLVGLPIFLLLKRERGTEIVASIGGWVDRHPGSTIAFAAPLFALILSFAALGTGEHGWSDFGLDFGYFVIGYVFLADSRFLPSVRRDLAGALIAAVAGTVGLLLLDFPGWLVDDAQHEVNLRSLVIVAAFVQEGWAWTLVVLNVGMRVPRFQRPLNPALGEAVLPVYVLHQPVILAVAYVVVQWSAGILPKWLVVLGVSAAATVLLVELALRNRYTRMLLGARRAAPAPETPLTGRSMRESQRAASH